MAGGTLRIESNNSAVSVSLTETASGSVTQLYSDSACTVAVAQPVTVASNTPVLLYVVNGGAYTLSVKASSVEIAGGYGATRQVVFDHGEFLGLRFNPSREGLPDLSGTVSARTHTTPDLSASMWAGAQAICGADTTLGKLWLYDISLNAGLYQIDSLTDMTTANVKLVTLPTNISTNGQPIKVVTSAVSGTNRMYLCGYNTVSARFEVYSAPIVAAGTAPTWTGPLLQLSANAVLMPHAFRACSTGVFVGEYSLGTDIAGGPSIWRSTNGSTFSRALGPLATTRHIHGIYEDKYNAGTIYAAMGDFFPPYSPPYAMYRSTDGGATFTGLPNVTSSIWQGVAMDFTRDYVWCFSDQWQGGGPYLLDRATHTPKWATTASRYDKIPVPGGVGGKIVTDASFNLGTSVTSTAANFVWTDAGRALSGNKSLPPDTVITSVNSATNVTINKNALTNWTGQTMWIGGDAFYSNAYAGAVDPATGYAYVVANDSSGPGTTAGIFILTQPGANYSLLYSFPVMFPGRNEAFIAGGSLLFDRYRIPLLTA